MDILQNHSIVKQLVEDIKTNNVSIPDMKLLCDTATEKLIEIMNREELQKINK